MLKSKSSARMLTLAGATALALGMTSGSQAGTDTSTIAVTATRPFVVSLMFVPIPD